MFERWRRCGYSALACGCLALLAPKASAHDAFTLAGLPQRWTFDPWLISGVCAASWLYIRGHLVLARRGAAAAAQRQRLCCFGLALATLVLALLSPLDGWSDGLFSA